MSAAQRAEMFAAARAFHAAAARYARALRSPKEDPELDRAAQHLMQASVRYRVALESLQPDADVRERLAHLCRLLAAGSRHYQATKKARKAATGGYGAGW